MSFDPIRRAWFKTQLEEEARRILGSLLDEDELFERKESK